jgi:hypothetical protein
MVAALHPPLPHQPRLLIVGDLQRKQLTPSDTRVLALGNRQDLPVASTLHVYFSAQAKHLDRVRRILRRSDVFFSAAATSVVRALDFAGLHKM